MNILISSVVIVSSLINLALPITLPNIKHLFKDRQVKQEIVKECLLSQSINESKYFNRCS